MYGDVTARPPSLAVRPTHEAYRSMPGTPMGMDGRGSRTMDLAAAMDHSRLGLDGGDYFLGAPRFPAGTLRPRSPMVPVPGQDWDHDHTYSAGGPMNNALGFRERDRERDLEDFIRKYAIGLSTNASLDLKSGLTLWQGEQGRGFTEWCNFSSRQICSGVSAPVR